MSKDILALGAITDPHIKRALHDFAVALIESAEGADSFDEWKGGLRSSLTDAGHHLVEEAADTAPRVPRRKK